MKSSKILLLEDDIILSKEIIEFLKYKKLDVVLAENGKQFWDYFDEDLFELLILDVNVPDENGISICEKIRNRNISTPIIFLTALGDISDKVKAFESGADDYLTKPFHFEELLLRINALFKRNKVSENEREIIKFSELTIDQTMKEVYRLNHKIQLTPKEYKLLLILINAKGHVLSKEFIAEKLWDYHIETNINTIEVYINFLRKKIDSPFDQKIIHTKVGFGYYLKKL
jgi:DNA-binding response OmpR family regulator